MRTRSTFVLGGLSIALLLACANSADPAHDAVATSGGEESASAVDADKALHAGPTRLEPPRVAMSVGLRSLWTRGGAVDDSLLLLPTEVHFSSHGLLVYDLGDRRLRVFDSSRDTVLFSVGREGRGPGEFGLGFQIQGSYAKPVAFDRVERRLTALGAIPEVLESRSLPNRKWGSTCALDSVRTLGSIASSGDAPPWVRAPGDSLFAPRYEFFIASGSAVVDSLLLPWEELRREDFLARQTFVRQLDDSTCVFLAPYQRRIATLGRDGAMVRGTYAETTAKVTTVTTVAPDGRSGRTALARGVRVGPLDARAWRESVIVLYGGHTRAASRLLDFYRRRDLEYEGSVSLPFRASRMALSGDTLAVLGERDEYPVLALYLLTKSTPGR